jgi:hypothetical protein
MNKNVSATAILRKSLLLALALSAAAAATVEDRAWVWVPGPPTPEDGMLLRVDAAGPNDVWAVGRELRYYDQFRYDQHTLAIHWDGTQWTQVPTPTPSAYPGPGGTHATLSDIGVVASDDVWVVGSANAVHPVTGTIGQQALVLHWDGAAWSQVPVPVTPEGTSGARLLGIDVLAPDDLWAVGSGPDPDHRQMLGYVLRWDGSQWRQLPFPPPVSASPHELRAVAALTPHNVWAVGGQSSQPYIVHWKGNGWRPVSGVPAPGFQTYLNDILALSASDVWIVGATNTGGTRPFFLHYDGSRWLEVPAEFPHPYGHLYAISGTAPDDLWAAGVFTAEPPPAPGRPLLMHWDGQAWTQVPADPAGPQFGTLWGLVALDAEDAWAVGFSGISLPLTERLRRNPPPALVSLTLAPSEVAGGQGATGTVTLSRPAQAGGAVVTLASSDPSAASVPASVTVPEGAAAASFPVSTSIVVEETTVTISASLGTTRQATLRVRGLLPSAL